MGDSKTRMDRKSEQLRFIQLLKDWKVEFEVVKGSHYTIKDLGHIWIEPTEKYIADESIAVTLERYNASVKHGVVNYYGAFISKDLYIITIDFIIENKDKFLITKYDKGSFQIPKKYFILFNKNLKLTNAMLNYEKNKKYNKIIWLHVHDEYSNRDGIGKNIDFVLKAKNSGQSALALTNHGNMSGSLNHYINCKSLNIKAIWGEEFYIVDDMYRKGFTEEEKLKFTEGLKTKKEKDALLSEKEKEADFRKYWHITVLAKNEIGYKNLIKLSSIAWIKGFYYKPRIDYKTLFEYKEGLIILSGCSSSKLAELTQKNWENGIKYIEELYKEFKDDLYLEVMLINYIPQLQLNKACYYLGKKFNIPCVLTNDIHYVIQKHSKVQDMYRKVSSKSEWSSNCDDLYFKTENELKESWEKNYKEFPWWFYEKAIKNTLLVNEKIENIKISLGEYILPKIKKKGGNKEYFVNRIKEGWKKYLGWIKDEDIKKIYKDRLKNEFSVIKKNNYIDYFLITLGVMDYVKNKMGRLAWARGSAAGSLISYLLDITLPDPIKHDLLFERFINSSRTGEIDVKYKSLPDIDMDVPDRDMAVDYLVKKYGRNKCCPIGSYDRIKIKSGIKMFGKIMSDAGESGWNFDELNAITRWMPEIEDISEITVGDRYVHEDWYYSLIKWYKQNKTWYKDIVEPVVGCPAWNSKHPAGMVITPKKLLNYVPLKIQDFKNENEEQQNAVRTIVTQWEDKYLEKRGLLKLDVLGLRTLKQLEEIVGEIKQIYKKDINLKEMGNHPNDEKVMAAFRKADTVCVMQFDSYHGKKGLSSMQPKKFGDLVALNALLRPGTSSAGTDRIYFDRMHGYEKIKYDHPLLEKVLKKTYGIMLYQEQITEAAHVVGGLSLSDADKFRTAIKKFDSEAMEKFKPQFIEGAIKNKCSRIEAEHIYNLVHSFSSYGFNKNHSCAYTLYGYFLMWFKVYYPLVFYHVMLCNPKDKKHLIEIKRDIEDHEIQLKMVDINLSKTKPVIVGKSLVWGLSSIKYVGEKVTPDIVKGQPYESIEDYIERSGKGSNKRVLETLLKAGAFDCFGESRKKQTEELFKVKGIDVSKEFKDYSKRSFWIKSSEEIYGFIHLPIVAGEE